MPWRFYAFLQEKLGTKEKGYKDTFTCTCNHRHDASYVHFQRTALSTLHKSSSVRAVSTLCLGVPVILYACGAPSTPMSMVPPSSSMFAVPPFSILQCSLHLPCP